MSDLKTDKSPPVPVEMPMSQAKDVPDKVTPVPADDPAVAVLADSVHANA